MSRSYNDIKDFLYAWLGKHSIKPEYQLSQCAESSKKVISFECRLFVPGFSFDCTAVGQSKKQAMTNAARKFCQLLIKQGLLGRLELRHAVPILDFEISHRDDMTEVKQPPSYNHFPTKSEMSLTSSHNLSVPAVTTSNISQKSDNHEQMDTDDIGDVLLRTESSLTFTPTATNSNSARETFIPTNDIELISARALLNQYFTRINFHHKHVFNITVSGPIHKP
ncbi:hypothetical protein GJ496_006947 [Pomphorhynchus laevis]|nr:hypothetical protein GJ496_006947 [Pomphorhynchus laevis]